MRGFFLIRFVLFRGFGVSLLSLLVCIFKGICILRVARGIDVCGGDRVFLFSMSWFRYSVYRCKGRVLFGFLVFF